MTDEPWAGADAPDDHEDHEDDGDGDPYFEHLLEQHLTDQERRQADDEALYEHQRDRDRDPDELFEEARYRWEQVGHALLTARLRLGLSKREAARRAGLSDGAWRHLEAGYKVSHGVQMLPNPRPENLIAAAKAVNLNPIVVFQIVHRDIPDELKYLAAPQPTELTATGRTAISLNGLTGNDIELIVNLIERLKGTPPLP